MLCVSGKRLFRCRRTIHLYRCFVAGRCRESLTRKVRPISLATLRRGPTDSESVVNPATCDRLSVDRPCRAEPSSDPVRPISLAFRGSPALRGVVEHRRKRVLRLASLNASAASESTSLPVVLRRFLSQSSAGAETPEIMRNFTETRDTAAKPASSKTSRPKCDVSRVAR